MSTGAVGARQNNNDWAATQWKIHYLCFTTAFLRNLTG